MYPGTLKKTSAACAAALFIIACACAVRNQTGNARSQAQTGSVEGKVLRQKDGSPIFDAVVKAAGTDKTAHTDRDGKYKVASLEVGKDYTLVMIKSPLYRDGTITVNVKAETNEADDVSLVRKSANELNIGAMLGLLDSGKYDEFVKRLSELKAACEGLKDADCEVIRKTDKIFDEKRPEKNLDKVRNSLDKLQSLDEGNEAGRPGLE